MAGGRRPPSSIFRFVIDSIVVCMADGRRPPHDIGRFSFHNLMNGWQPNTFYGFLICCMCFSGAGRPSVCRVASLCLRCVWWAATRPLAPADCAVDCFATHAGRPIAIVCSCTFFSACSVEMTISGVGIVCYEWCSLIIFYVSAWWARLGGHQL